MSFIPKENITRKLRGHIIMTSRGYLKVVGPKGKTEPYNPTSWKKGNRK